MHIVDIFTKLTEYLQVLTFYKIKVTIFQHLP